MRLAPNDARVRGAGPARKTFVRPKACPAPNPLQPIVRPQLPPAFPTRRRSILWNDVSIVTKFMTTDSPSFSNFPISKVEQDQSQPDRDVERIKKAAAPPVREVAPTRVQS